MSDSGNCLDCLEDSLPMGESICPVPEDQLVEGQSPTTGSPIKGRAETPELRGQSFVPEQMQSLEKELNETWAQLAEFSESVQEAKSELDFALTIIKSAAAALKLDWPGKASGSMAATEQTEMPEVSKMSKQSKQSKQPEQPEQSKQPEQPTQ